MTDLKTIIMRYWVWWAMSGIGIAIMLGSPEDISFYCGGIVAVLGLVMQLQQQIHDLKERVKDLEKRLDESL